MTNHQQGKIEDFKIRHAVSGDSALILDFIKALAVYEHLEHAVSATEESIRKSIFEKKEAEVLIGEYQGKPVSFALFYTNYSTFLGKSNLFLEDIYVHEPYRGRGYGSTMISYIANLAVERGCERLDWMCLDWNTSAINFYQEIGATHMKEWTLFRVKKDELKTLALKNQKG
jgi:GNAT superfamily N-acetyltransferase